MRYPLGIQTFENIRIDGYLYMDKTALVYDLVKGGTYYFLSRPRRFGKSLLVSTLEAYFRGKRELFSGLAIERLEKDWTAYPVLKLSLNVAKYDSPSVLEAVLHDAVDTWCRQYGISVAGETPSLRFKNLLTALYEKTGKKVVVLLNIGGVIETDSWKALPDAILCAWQAGQEGGNSVVDVLSGKQSPSGKFTMTWPVNFNDAYSSKNFPIDEDPRIDMTKQGQKGNVRNVDFTDYEEDVYVGYRYFDSFEVPVSYPFGFGLSYTSFELTDAKVTPKGDGFEVSVVVKNTGERDGKEVVQVYVAAPDSKAANKPAKELKAFAKTRLLKPGESQTLTMQVKTADLASFDENTSAWVVAAGTYQFLVGVSSQDIKASLTTAVKAQTQKVNDVMKPQTKMNLLKRQ